MRLPSSGGHTRAAVVRRRRNTGKRRKTEASADRPRARSGSADALEAPAAVKRSLSESTEGGL